MYIYVWVNYNYNDLALLPHYNHGLYNIRGIIPKIAKHFRLVNYYNLPRYVGLNGSLS